MSQQQLIDTLKAEIRGHTKKLHPYTGPHVNADMAALAKPFVAIFIGGALLLFALMMDGYTPPNFSAGDGLTIIILCAIAASVLMYGTGLSKVSDKTRLAQAEYERFIDVEAGKWLQIQIDSEFTGALNHYSGAGSLVPRLHRDTTPEVRAAVEAQFGADAKFIRMIDADAARAIAELQCGPYGDLPRRDARDGLVCVFKYDRCRNTQGKSVVDIRLERRQRAMDDAEDRVFAARVKVQANQAAKQIRLSGTSPPLNWDPSVPVRRT